MYVYKLHTQINKLHTSQNIYDMVQLERTEQKYKKFTKEVLMVDEIILLENCFCSTCGGQIVVEPCHELDKTYPVVYGGKNVKKITTRYVCSVCRLLFYPNKDGVCGCRR